jgi:hypothetical protein
MTRGLRAGAVALAFLVSGPISPLALGVQASHTIEIRVANGTAGGEVPDGLGVTAIRFSGEGERLGERTARVTGGRARIVFDALGEVSYVVTATYLGVTYSTAVERSSSQGPTHPADITIYEATDDPSVVAVEADTLTVVLGAEETLEVLQLFEFTNSSDRTFLGVDEEVLELPLPNGAYDTLPLSGISGEPVAGGAGFFTSDPLLPGGTSVSYLYKIDVPRSGWSLDKPILHPTTRFDLLLGEGLEVRSPALTFEEEVTLAGTSYRRHRARELDAGSTLSAAVVYESAGGQTIPTAGLVAALAVLVLVAVGVPALLGRRRRAPVSVEARQALVEEIATLDVEFEDGKIATPDYRKWRAALVKRLASMGADRIPR